MPAACNDNMTSGIVQINGIYVRDMSPTVPLNPVNLLCAGAGAVHGGLGHLIILNTTFTNNTAFRNGGGLYMRTRTADNGSSIPLGDLISRYPQSVLIFKNCTVEGAKAHGSGGE